MKLSLAWLREWVNLPDDAQALCERLTLAGLESRAEPLVGSLPTGVVVGRIESVAPHPQADRLRVCRVDVGQGAALQIVCGAANARAGLNAPCALVGARLPGGAAITTARVRGVESFGMLCSAQELGLAEKSDGLLELDREARPGTPIERHLSFDDHIVELELTPNRGDCLSVLGLAREIAALYALPLRRPSLSPAVVVGDKVLRVDLQAPEDCPTYTGRLIKRLRPDARTPDWMRERLRRSGLRCIHPVVDITNYVMLELGQPLHAFDFEKLSGGVQIRRARPGEVLTLLNEQRLAFSGVELVIADERGPVALAGVMGGAESGVGEGTTAIFLESACFTPAAVARAARVHGLHSDSLYRFERGVDPGLQRTALDRASQLIAQICGGEVHPVTAAGRNHPEPVTLSLRAARVEQLLGVAVTPREVETLLGRLGMTLRHDVGGSWQVRVPSHRTDLRLEVDLIEEVARLIGYDKITPRPYAAQLPPASRTETRRSAQAFRDRLVARGWQEIVSLAFVDPRLQAPFADPGATVAVDNPIAETLAELRVSLWPGLIAAWCHNLQRQIRRVRLFESAVCFRQIGEGVQETAMLAGLAAGDARPEQWGEPARATDFYDVKADLEALLPRPSDLVCEVATHPALHPGQSARLLRDGQVLGWLGRLHPRIVQTLELPEAPILFALKLAVLSPVALPRGRTPSEFPSSRRDLAVVVAEEVPAGALLASARAAGGAALVEAQVFDVYRGEGIGTGRKSVAIGLIFNDYSRTLTQAEIEGHIADILAAWQREWGAVVRA